MVTTVRLCKDAQCPSALPHNEGYYNFTLDDDKYLSNKLPSDILAARTRILSATNPGPNLDDWNFFTKFAVVHQSHREWLLPRSITSLPGWNSRPIIIIRKSAKWLPQDLRSREELVAIEKKHSSLEKGKIVDDASKNPIAQAEKNLTLKNQKQAQGTTGRRFAMGRGVDLSKKPVYPLPLFVALEGVPMVKNQG